MTEGAGAASQFEERPQPPTARQIESLRILLLHPTRFVGRRVDRVLHLGEKSIRWHVLLQVEMPPVLAGPESQEVNRNSVFSLGLFEKKRLPDLVCRNGSGALVPILRRSARSDYLALLLVWDLISSELLGEAEMSNLSHLAGRIVVAEPATARAAYGDYESLLRDKLAGSDQFDVESHLRFVTHFVETTHVLAVVPDDADRGPFFVEYEYSEGSRTRGLRDIVSAEIPMKSKIGLAGRLVGMNLALSSVPVDFVLGGANHAHSYYLLVDAPEGSELEDLSWKKVSEQDDADPSIVMVHQSASSALECYHANFDVEGGHARANLRLNGSHLRYVWFVDVLLLAFAFLVSRRPEGEYSGAFAALVALPGAALAAFTQSRHALTMRIGRWQRRIHVLLVALSLLLAVALSGDVLPNDSDIKMLFWEFDITRFSDEVSARAMVAGAAFATVLMSYICFRRPSRATPSKPGYPLQSSDVTDEHSKGRTAALVVFGSAALLSLLGALL